MKKKGYTLAEALIAMGVIGVVAALMLPMYSKYRPDANKALFVRTYDSIVEAVSVLVANDEFYPHEETIEDDPDDCDKTETCNYWDYSSAPFLNDKPIRLINDNYIGKNGDALEKLCDALVYQMHAASYSCGNGSITLVNNVDLELEKTNDDNCYKIRIGLPNGKSGNSHSILVFANGHIVLDPEAGTLEETYDYLKTRSNWKKSDKNANIKVNKAHLIDTINYWRIYSQKVKRNYDGSFAED